jgi:phosphocarrier protein HPr
MMNLQMNDKDQAGMQSTKFVCGVLTIKNDRGLHTRPSTELVRCASTFESEIFLRHQRHYVNAKSLLGILMLAAAKGSKITIEARGNDAEKAVESLINLADKKFGINY